ncbi:MAG: hypothetical protein ABI890_11675 [Lapillicoccus sp.]
MHRRRWAFIGLGMAVVAGVAVGSRQRGRASPLYSPPHFPPMPDPHARSPRVVAQLAPEALSLSSEARTEWFMSWGRLGTLGKWGSIPELTEWGDPTIPATVEFMFQPGSTDEQVLELLALLEADPLIVNAQRVDDRPSLAEQDPRWDIGGR